MRPAQRARQAEDAASKLSSLVRSPQVAQLLQQPVPAQPTAAQRAVLASCSSRLDLLYRAMPASLSSSSSGTEAFVQMLRRALGQQPTHSAGVLLAWLQQQPQQLAAALQGVLSIGVQPGTTEAVWCIGMQAVARLAELLLDCCAAKSSSCTATVAELTVNMTQQLLQSGGCICCC